jgi:hypothetical protein
VNNKITKYWWMKIKKKTEKKKKKKPKQALEKLCKPKLIS